MCLSFSSGYFLILCYLLITAAPHEFTSIPFPVKALKILLHDVQSGGESATITAQNDTYDVDSDDGVSMGARSFVAELNFAHNRTKTGQKKKS